MLFMVVERFADAREIYRRVREDGRSLPDVEAFEIVPVTPSRVTQELMARR